MHETAEMTELYKELFTLREKLRENQEMKKNEIETMKTEYEKTITDLNAEFKRQQEHQQEMHVFYDSFNKKKYFLVYDA